MREIDSPNGAVAELMKAEYQDRVFGVHGHMLPVPVPVPPRPVPPRFPPPDWEEERIERLQREAAEKRARLDQEVAAELAKITDDSEEPERYPAQPRKRRGWFAKEQP